MWVSVAPLCPQRERIFSAIRKDCFHCHLYMYVSVCVCAPFYSQIYINAPVFTLGPPLWKYLEPLSTLYVTKACRPALQLHRKGALFKSLRNSPHAPGHDIVLRSFNELFGNLTPFFFRRNLQK